MGRSVARSVLQHVSTRDEPTAQKNRAGTLMAPLIVCRVHSITVLREKRLESQAIAEEPSPKLRSTSLVNTVYRLEAGIRRASSGFLSLAVSVLPRAFWKG